MKGLENDQPCFGRFFIETSKYVPVNEYSCVKMDDIAM